MYKKNSKTKPVVPHPALTGIVRHHGQILDALLDASSDQVLRNATQPETAHQQFGAVRDVGNGFLRGFENLAAPFRCRVATGEHLQETETEIVTYVYREFDGCGRCISDSLAIVHDDVDVLI